MSQPTPLLTAQKPARLNRFHATICIVTLLTFVPVLHHDFGGWDDSQNITDNPWLNPPSWGGVARYWRAPAVDLYVPITWTVWSALASIAQLREADPSGAHLNPVIFHAANLLAHILAAMCAFELLRRWLRNDFAAAAGALLFAIHPVQVEAVAWVNGLKDVLAGMFALAALLVLLRRSRFIFATLLFVLAILSKPSAVVLPFIALALGQSRVRVAIWIVIAAGFAILAHYAQPAPFFGPEYSIAKRPLVAFDAIAFYVWKILWPTHLACDYGRQSWRVLASNSVYWTWLIPAALAVVMIGFRRKLCRGLSRNFVSVAIAVSIIAIVPVLGLIPFDFQAYSTVADHYLYLAMLGVAILFGLLVSRSRYFALLLVPLAMLTFRQAQTWNDSLSIARQTVSVNPNSFVWSDRLAIAMIRQGNPTEALRLATHATESEPTFEPAWVTRGIAAAMLGDHASAADCFRRAVQLNPTDSRAKAALADAIQAQSGLRKGD